MGEEGGWRLSPKVPHAPTHSATPWKRVCSRIYAHPARRFSLGRVRSCVFRRVHEDEGDDDEVEEGTYAREFRSGTSERTGVTFRLKGKRRV